MAVADAGEIREFAAALTRFADGIDELVHQALGTLDALGESWEDEGYERFRTEFGATAGPIGSFALEGRGYAQRLVERADLIDQAAAHSVGAAVGSGSLGGSASDGGASKAGSASSSTTGEERALSTGGRHRPGTAPAPVDGRLAGYGNVLAYKTSSDGVAFLHPNDGAAGNALVLRPYRNCLDLMMHGFVNPNGHSANTVQIPLADGTHVEVTAQEFARFLIAANGGPITRPVRLCACKTGQFKGGFAAQLARELGVAVVAPRQSIWFDAKGRTLWSGPFGIRRRATWRVFSPGGQVWESSDRKIDAARPWREI